MSLNFSVKSFLSLLLVFGAGCATPIYKSIEELKTGDDKATAVELLGNPKQTLRRDGKDFWIYRYFRDESEFKRVLIFESGRLISIKPEERIADPRENLIEQQLEEMSTQPSASPL